MRMRLKEGCYIFGDFIACEDCQYVGDCEVRSNGETTWVRYEYDD